MGLLLWLAGAVYITGPAPPWAGAGPGPGEGLPPLARHRDGHEHALVPRAVVDDAGPKPGGAVHDGGGDEHAAGRFRARTGRLSRVPEGPRPPEAAVTPEERLAELGIVLPPPPPARAAPV